MSTAGAGGGATGGSSGSFGFVMGAGGGTGTGGGEGFFATGVGGNQSLLDGCGLGLSFGGSLRGDSFGSGGASNDGGAGSCDAVRQVERRFSAGAGGGVVTTAGGADGAGGAGRAATTGAGGSAVSGGTLRGPLHLGQRIFFPAAASGRRNFPSQLGQTASTGMRGGLVQTGGGSATNTYPAHRRGGLLEAAEVFNRSRPATWRWPRRVRSADRVRRRDAGAAELRVRGQGTH